MDTSTLPFERSFYVGILLAEILYGIQISITILSVYLLLNDESRRNQRIFYVIYSVVILICMTIAKAANAHLGQLMWIDHRDFPGGPAAYWAANNGVWYNVLGAAVDVFANIMGDALLLYRCYIIWNSKRIIIIPTLIFLASVALSIISVIESAQPGSNFYATLAAMFEIPWISLTSGLNFVLTALITIRLLIHRRSMALITTSNFTAMYPGIIAILVESAAPFTAAGIVFAVLLGKNHPGQTAVSLVWGTFVGLSPQLIILRVAMGRAWTNRTFIAVPIMEFASPGLVSIQQRTQTETAFKTNPQFHGMGSTSGGTAPALRGHPSEGSDSTLPTKEYPKGIF